MRLWRVSVVVVGVLFGVSVGCSSSSGSGEADALKPGDHFFRTAVAGSGSTSGTANIALLDPDLAARRKPGSPGTTAGSLEVVGNYYPAMGTPVRLRGTYDRSGKLTAAGGGWSFTGQAGSTAVTGSVSGPSGEEATFAGVDVMTGRVGAFCGTYSGSASGQWNFVVGASGKLSGAFSGRAAGTLDGTASGDAVKISWSGTAGGNGASGSAAGSIGANGTISGTWSGSSDGIGVQGRWSSASVCPGPDPVLIEDPGPSCTCQASGSCCPGGPCCVE